MIKVFDPDGEEIFASNTINNTTFPLTFNTNIRIGEGVYALHVIDDDDGGEGADDLCGVITLNQQTNGTITAGPLRATLSVLHPVDTVISMDTVRVFAQPAPPEFVEFIPFIPCMGDTIPLEVVNYDESLQWYRDSLPLAVDSNVLAITESGVYWVVYTSPEGCQSVSEQRLYGFATPPQSFTLVQMGNLLRSPQEGNWPDTYSYQWSRNGEAIEGATEPKYCATANGSYTLHLTDELTGCTRSITLANVTHDPGLPCTTPTQEPEVAGAWTLYPNPSAGQVWLRYDGPLSGRVNIRLFDALGRLVHTQVESYGGAGAAVELLTPELAAGVYWLDVSGVDGLSLYRERVVVQ